MCPKSSDGRTLAFKTRGPAISVCVLNPQMVEHWLSRREVSRLFLGYSNIYSTLHYEHHLLELTRGNPRAVYRYNTLSPLWCTTSLKSPLLRVCNELKNTHFPPTLSIVSPLHCRKYVPPSFILCLHELLFMLTIVVLNSLYIGLRRSQLDVYKMKVFTIRYNK